MLTGMNIAVVGGDARQLEVIRKLIEWDAKVHLIGFDQLDHGYIGAAKESYENLTFELLDAMILPVAGTKADGEIDSLFSTEHLVLSKEQVERTPEHFTIYTGISNNYLDELAHRTNRKLVKLFDRDDVAIYNSIPTAEGTVMMAIQHTDYTIHGSNVAVLGFGRTGMSVARMFHALGAKVKVGARKPEDIARITEMTFQPFHMNKLHHEVKEMDIVINTVPYPIVTASVIANVPPHGLIIDLASKPGGTDFRYAEKRGIKAILAPGLPGIVAPKTAGRILGNVLVSLLQEQRIIREET